MRTKDPEKKQLIIETALNLFLEIGPSNISMSDIAKDCGLAVGTLYLYFQDKKSLAGECLSEYFSDHDQHSEEVFGTKESIRKQMIFYLKKRFDAHKRLRVGAGATDFCYFVMSHFPESRERETEKLTKTISEKLVSANECGAITLNDPQRDVRVFLLSLAWFFPHPTDEFRDPPKWSACEDTINWFFDLWES